MSDEQHNYSPSPRTACSPKDLSDCLAEIMNTMMKAVWPSAGP